MSKTFKRLLLIAVVLLVAVGALIVIKPGLFMDFGMWLTASKKHRNAAEEKPAYTLTSQALSDAFKSDTSSLAKYVDKSILLEGPITAIEGTHLSFGNVVCSVDSANLSSLSNLKTGQTAKVQGRLVSYNDLMEEIELDQCVLK